MNRNIIETVLGAVVLLVAAVFLTFAGTHSDVGKKDGYIVKADFNRIDGLKAGSDVRMNGVMVGSVMKIELNKQSYVATVSFSVDPSIKLPRDTIAQIASESLLGGKYLSLEVGADEDMVSTDGKGKLTRTTPPMRLDDLIGQLIYKEDGKKTAAATPANAAPAAGTQNQLPPPPAPSSPASTQQ